MGLLQTDPYKEILKKLQKKWRERVATSVAPQRSLTSG